MSDVLSALWWLVNPMDLACSVSYRLLGFGPGPWPLVPAGLHGAHRSPSGAGVEERQPRLESDFPFENRMHSASQRRGQRTGIALCDSGFAVLWDEAYMGCTFDYPTVF